MKFVSSLNTSLEKILEKHREVVLYGEDILDPYGGAFKVTKGLSSKFPDRVLSTPISESAMIGMAGLEKFKLNQFNNLDYPAKPRWPLDEKANFLKGAGVKL